MEQTPKPAPPEVAEDAPAAAPPPGGQAMDVVAKPPVETAAAAPPDEATSLADAASSEAAPAPAQHVPPKPAKQSYNGVTAAIIATVIVAIALAGLATMAYLKSAK